MTSLEKVQSRLRIAQLNKGQYNEVERSKAVKKQIVLHHTAGGSAQSSINGWNADATPVATAFVIDRDGTIFQAFPSWCWAYALGVNQANYRTLEAQAVQIELASYGTLKQLNGEYYNAYGSKIKPENVCVLDKPFRGSKFYEKYTPEQIESTKVLIEYLSEAYNITLNYKPDIFDINQRALRGESGLFTHCSFRSDKSDVYPQPELIQMLSSLNATT